MLGDFGKKRCFYRHDDPPDPTHSGPEPAVPNRYETYELRRQVADVPSGSGTGSGAGKGKGSKRKR